MFVHAHFVNFFSKDTISTTHMTGSTHLDIEQDLTDESTTRVPERVPSNIPAETNGKTYPTIEHAKLVSRSEIEVQFTTNVRASKECSGDVRFDSSSPHICCQMIFREKPLLKGNKLL